MNLKHIIVCAIICILMATTAFCAGMHHAIRAMQIDNTGAITLHNQVYLHSFGE